MTTQTDDTHMRRPYHSPTRRQRAAATRARILDAARALFVALGYAGTTLEAIAARAEASPKTVAAVFGSKRDILAALVDPSALGQRFDAIRAQMGSATEPGQRVALAARLARRAYEDLGSEFALLRGTQAVAPEVASLAREVGERRRRNQASLIVFLVEHGALRRGLAREAAADVLWTLTGYDLYHALVVECGWAPERYEVWLARALTQHLLEPRTGEHTSEHA